MKFNKFFMGLGMAAALCLGACSDDEPANVGGNPDDAGYGDKYLTVSVMMPTSLGSRAAGQGDNDLDKYDKGTAEESTVSNIVFFFFDDNNNVIDIQKYDNPKFEEVENMENPYVSNFGKEEVRLKSGFNYKQVAVVLNSSAKNASELISSIKTLDDLLAREQNYAGQVGDNGTNQVMSNSVFYNTTDCNIAPTQDTKYILVPITAKNIYTDAERKSIEYLFKKGDKEIVDIYVERVASKVSVTSNINMAKYYTSEEGVKTITLYDNVNLTTKKVVIKPSVKGITLNVLANNASLIKNITHNQLGYENPIAKGFLWNDPFNKRSYWAQTPSYGKVGMIYYSWDEVEQAAATDLSDYINPNTQDFTPGKENNSLNTKVMLVAQLFAYDENDTEYAEPISIDLVRYGSEYMESSNLLAHIANLVNVGVRSINWDMLGKDYSRAEIEALKTAVSHAFETGFEGKDFLIKAAGTDADRFDTYSAVIDKIDEFGYTISMDKTWFEKFSFAYDENTDPAEVAYLEELKKYVDNEDGAFDALVEKAKEKTIDPAINGVFDQANKPNILYWKDGKTYFYTTIHHEGFYGLAGGEKYLNGVVRNHIYSVDLQGLYGLGTPVINPGKPIDPERPEMERPSYLQARINILPWRVVKNNADLH